MAKQSYRTYRATKPKGRNALYRQCDRCGNDRRLGKPMYGNTLCLDCRQTDPLVFARSRG